jgi:hypothetical protein
LTAFAHFLGGAIVDETLASDDAWRDWLEGHNT